MSHPIVMAYGNMNGNFWVSSCLFHQKAFKILHSFNYFFRITVLSFCQVICSNPTLYFYHVDLLLVRRTSDWR